MIIRYKVLPPTLKTVCMRSNSTTISSHLNRRGISCPSNPGQTHPQVRPAPPHPTHPYQKSSHELVGWQVVCALSFPHTLAHNSSSSLSSASRLLGTPGLLAYHRCSCIRLVWQRGRPRRGTRHSPIIETHPTGVDGAAAQGLGPAFLFPYLVSIGESEKSNAPVRCALVSGHRPQVFAPSRRPVASTHTAWQQPPFYMTAKWPAALLF